MENNEENIYVGTGAYNNIVNNIIDNFSIVRKCTVNTLLSQSASEGW